jgi:hypothetical protein
LGWHALMLGALVVARFSQSGTPLPFSGAVACGAVGIVLGWLLTGDASAFAAGVSLACSLALLASWTLGWAGYFRAQRRAVQNAS